MKSLEVETRIPSGKKWIRENAPILTLLALFVLAKAPSLSTPFWWDEAGVYIPPSIIVATSGLSIALPGMHPKGLLGGHPPVLYLLHGIIYQLLAGQGYILPHRVAALAFAVIGLVFTYRLGRLLAGRSTGVCAAILFACSPMFFAQSTMVLGDMPIAALAVTCLYYLLTKQWWAYVVTATVLVQTKETALAIPVAAALYQFFTWPRGPERWRRLMMHAIPIGSLVVFFGIEYVATGSFIQASFFDTRPLLMFDLSDPKRAAQAILTQGLWVTGVIFYGEGRFILTGLILLGIAQWRKFWKPELILFGLVVASYWGAFSLIGFLPRYVMPVLPFLCIAAALSVCVTVRTYKVAQYAIACIATAIFVPYFYSESESGNFETNMGYEKAVAVCESLSQYIEVNFRTATIAADWPMSSYLGITELGYVSTLRRVRETESMKSDEDLPTDLFVYFSIAPSAQTVNRLMSMTNPPLRRFQESGIVAEVYALR